MGAPSVPNTYPLEIAPPDISAYAPGNAGIPYVWQFDGPEPGPDALITAVVHGNEPCGAVALDWLLARGFRPARGRLTLAFANIAAYEAFDPADPNASRWVDEDFNRVWSSEVLDGPRRSVELERARALRPVVAAADYLLDIHSMQHVAPPLAMSGPLAKGRALAEAVGLPERVVADRGHAAGLRMRDHGALGDPARAAAALLLECGQHWEAGAASLAKRAAARFLAALRMAGPDLEASLEEPAPPAAPQAAFEVTDVVTIETEAFRFARPLTGGEIIPEAGTLIAHDGPREIRTPYADCMAVMPSLRLIPGLTAVRLARRLS
ncbi:MAG: succinylglutamate desuccinylase/aspartoacylase family protein [Pseudomonadota bacterium]